MILKSELTENGAVLTMCEDGENPLAHMIFDAGQLSAVIASLAQIRAQMALFPENPIGMTMDAIPGPAYWTEREPLTEHTNLCLPHPGFGWLSFLLPDQMTEHLVSLWAAQKALPRAQDGKPN